jgi:hypothetical protein
MEPELIVTAGVERSCGTSGLATFRQKGPSRATGDHGVRDVDTFFISAHQVAPACHPSESPPHRAKARKDLKFLSSIAAPQVERRDFIISELAPIAGAERAASGLAPFAITYQTWIMTSLKEHTAHQMAKAKAQPEKFKNSFSRSL